jgi:hypothetical protein
MAEKRIIRTEAKQEVEEEETVVEPTWSEWSRGTFLRYWFFLGAFALDAFTVLQLRYSLDWPYSLYASVLLLVLLIFVEYRLYIFLWGDDGKWCY